VEQHHVELLSVDHEVVDHGHYGQGLVVETFIYRYSSILIFHVNSNSFLSGRWVDGKVLAA